MQGIESVPNSSSTPVQKILRVPAITDLAGVDEAELYNVLSMAQAEVRQVGIRAYGPDIAERADGVVWLRVVYQSVEKRSGHRHDVPSHRSVQRTAVKQRPHQETRRRQVATSEPVVLHHGREGGSDACHEAR